MSAPRRVLLASEGRAFSAAAIATAADVARPAGALVSVLSIARVWGTAFGFPNPWLMPSRRELDEQRALVGSAVQALQAQGLDASGRVIATRNAARRIVQEAARQGCDALVMGADPERHWLMRDLLWSQEPYRVRRRARCRVYLAVQPTPPASLFAPAA
jgi:nucleotide-binding universal stress UspA family protein